MTFEEYIYVAQIIVSIALTLVILFQSKGSDVGGIFGGSSGGGSFRTRRGIEKTLFQLTIVLALVFLVISAWSVRANITN
jgi:preprotein translocase subunit SecG